MSGAGTGDARTEEPLTTQLTPAEGSGEAPVSPPAPGRIDGVPFRDFGVDEVICTALDDAGMHTTFPIQALTLPLAMAGQDIIGQARTGTGKTLAFGVPMLQQLVTTLAASRETKPPAGLIIVPTRELAVQVADDLKQAGARLGARGVPTSGGRGHHAQSGGPRGP